MSSLAAIEPSTDTVAAEELVERVKDGDSEALDILVRAYLPRVYDVVQSLVPESDADDVTQEVFLSVVDSIWKFESRSTFSTWLYRITKNKIADYYRRKSRNRETALDDQQDFESFYPWDIIDSELIVKAALAMLPDKPREILLMKFLYGLSFREIGDRLGLTYEGVRSRYRRAIYMVQQQFEHDSIALDRENLVS